MSATLNFPKTHNTLVGQPVVADKTAVLQESCLDSENLLCGRKSVAIVHNGATYRLQATKLGKLILTK